MPFKRNSLEPSPILVPSEPPASGHHGFADWGHDAKITEIGVIPTGGSPGQGKASGSEGWRQGLGRIAKCTTLNWVQAPHGHGDMGPPIDHTGGLNWGPKRGSFWLPKVSPNRRYPQ